MPPLTPAEIGWNLLGKLEPITRHAGTELVDRARLPGDRPGTQRRLDQRFVQVAPTGQQLPDPAAQAEDEQHRADDGQGQVRRQAGAQQGDPQRQHDRPGRRPRHFHAPGDRRILPVRRAVDGACHASVRDLTIETRDRLTHRPTRYTRVKTTSQTPSTKCQYQETTSTPVSFRSVICLRHARPKTMLITITPMVTCKA